MNDEATYAEQRLEMVPTQIEARGIRDPRVLAAARRVARHQFVPGALREHAYADRSLRLGEGQSISQPYVVALMTELVQNGGARALDVGSGSGYQTALLAETFAQVWSIEIDPELLETARARLCGLGYAQIEFQRGDGSGGWPEAAPFDAIVVACAAAEVPEPLVAQLAPGGRLVMPIGARHQELVVVEKLPDGSTRRRSEGAVAFVPMLTKRAGTE